MELTALKKFLYKEKPLATFESISKNGIRYKLELPDRNVHFLIPLEEIGNATFPIGLEAQLLIRYIVQ